MSCDLLGICLYLSAADTCDPPLLMLENVQTILKTGRMSQTFSGSDGHTFSDS
jgi:hypothetical protein